MPASIARLLLTTQGLQVLQSLVPRVTHEGADGTLVTAEFQARSFGNVELAEACRMLAVEDGAGRAWCKAHGYRGYTSYGSLNDLPSTSSLTRSQPPASRASRSVRIASSAVKQPAVLGR